MSFSQSKCCICLENKDFYTECNHCKDGKYCETCITKLIEENKYITCSVCRQEHWYNNKKQLQILIDKQKKVIGTSLDETYISSDEEDTISNVLQQHEENYCKAIRNICCSISLISLLTFLGWVTIFGLSEVKLNVPEDYQILCILMISLVGGFILVVGFWGLLIGCVKINKYCNNNSCITCGEFMLTGFCLTISTSFGYGFTFILCELHTNYSNNDKLNSLIIITISIASGIALVIGSLIIIILNKNIYELLKEKCDDIIAECCCNPLFIMIHILISMFIIQIGRMIIFDTIKIDLHVNKEHKLILEILISYLVGVSIFIIPLSLISLICVKDTIFKCKCNCKKERSMQESININEII